MQKFEFSVVAHNNQDEILSVMQIDAADLGAAHIVANAMFENTGLEVILLSPSDG